MRKLPRPEEIHRLLAEVRLRAAADATRCIQCGKCSAGCPAAPEMDLLPSQVLRLLQTGGEDRILGSRTIWLCAGCQACTTRCPEDIDIALVMDTLRKIVRERRLAPREKEIGVFNRVFLYSVRAFGRLYEFGLVLGFNLLSKKLMKDVLLAPLLFSKGKISLLPHLSPRDIREIGEIYRRAQRFLPPEEERKK